MAITGQTPISDQEALFRRWNPYSEDNPQPLNEVVVPDKYVDYINDQNPYYYWRSNTINDFGLNSGGPGHQQYYPWFDKGPVIWDGTRMVYMPEFDPQLYDNPPEVPEKYRMRHIAAPYIFGNWIKDKDGRPIRPIETKVIEGDPTENIGNQLLFDALTLYRLPFKAVTNVGKAVFNGSKWIDPQYALSKLGRIIGKEEGAEAGRIVGTGLNGLLGTYATYNGLEDVAAGVHQSDPSLVAQGIGETALGIMNFGGGIGPAIAGVKNANTINNISRVASNTGRGFTSAIRTATNAAKNVGRNVVNTIKNHPRTAAASIVLPLTAVAADAAKVVMDNINGQEISENNGNVENADTVFMPNGQPWIMDNQYVLRVPNPTLGDSLMNVIKEDWPLLIPAAGMVVGASPRLWRTLSKFKRPKMYTNAAGEKVPVPIGERPAPYEPATKVPGEPVPTRKRVGISHKDLPLQPKVDPFDAFGTPEEQAAAFLKADERLNQWRKDVEAIKKAKKQERAAKQAKADEEYKKAKAEYDKKLEEYNAKLEEEYNKKNKKANDEWNAYEASKEYQAFLSRRPWHKKWDNWLMGSSALGLASGIVYKYNKNKEPEYRYVLGGNYGNQNSNVTPESENIDDSARNATGNYIDAIYSPDQTPLQTPNSEAVPGALPDTLY